MSKSNTRGKASPEACRNSVYARYETLTIALNKPELISKALFDACASQSALAALELSKDDITPIARNSMYKYADQVLSGYKTPDGKVGRHYLDWLRKEVRKHAVNKNGYRSKKAIKSRAKLRQKETGDKLDTVEAAMLARSKAYLHLFQTVRNLAQSDDVEPATRQRIFNLINDHDSLYGDLFDEDGCSIRSANVEALNQ